MLYRIALERGDEPRLEEIQRLLPLVEETRKTLKERFANHRLSHEKSAAQVA